MGGWKFMIYWYYGMLCIVCIWFYKYRERYERVLSSLLLGRGEEVEGKRREDNGKERGIFMVNSI